MILVCKSLMLVIIARWQSIIIEVFNWVLNVISQWFAVITCTSAIFIW